MQTMLGSQAAAVWFAAAFLGGLALNLTPCVYPMIPVTLAFFSGQAAGRTSQTVRLACLYLLGMSLMYALLGLVASQTGAMFGSWLQKPAVVVVLAALMAALALSMFGLYELQPPAWFTQRFGSGLSGGAGAFVMGLTVGVMAAPCVGPFILGLLLFVSRLAKPWLGFALMLTMGIGMGLPFVVIGVAANRTSHLPKAGAWMVWIKRLLGVGLLAMALYFLRPLIGATTFAWLLAAGLVAAGIYLGWLDRSAQPGSNAAFRWMRWIVGGLLIVGAIAVIPRPASRQSATSGVTWQPFHAEQFEQAKQSGRPILVDVSADWCVPCIELDHTTFHHPKVIERLGEIVTFRIDATQDVPADAQALLDRYGIVGVPTVLMFDQHGVERSDLRVQGFTPPDEFLQRIDRLQHS